MKNKYLKNNTESKSVWERNIYFIWIFSPENYLTENKQFYIFLPLVFLNKN